MPVETFLLEDRLAPHCNVSYHCQDPDSEACRKARRCVWNWLHRLVEYWWWVRIRDTLHIPRDISPFPLPPLPGPDPAPFGFGKGEGIPAAPGRLPPFSLPGILEEERLLDDLLGRNRLAGKEVFPSLRDAILREGLHVKAARSLADRLQKAADGLREEADMLEKAGST
jgi:hypothetical protein